MASKIIKRASAVYSHYNGGETAAQVLGRDCDLEYLGREARYPLSGYGRHNQIYRVVGTDDAVIIWNDTTGTNLVGGIEVRGGWFASRRAHGKRCRAVAEATGLPFEAVLAVGPERAAELAEATAQVRACACVSGQGWCVYTTPAPKGEIVLHSEGVHALQKCGIARRKDVLVALLPNFAETIGKMGQKNSTRLAELLLRRAGLSGVDRY